MSLKPTCVIFTRRIPKTEIESAIQNRILGNRLIVAPYLAIAITSVGDNLADWLTLLESYPFLAMRYWHRYTTSDSDEDLTLLSTEASKQVSVDLVLAAIGEFYSVPLNWGAVISIAGNRVDDLLKAIRHIAVQQEPETGDWDAEVSTFALSFPGDACLIPAVITAIMDRYHHFRASSLLGQGRQVQRQASEWLNATLANIFPDTAHLHALLEGEHGVLIKAATVMTLMIIPSTELMPAAWEELILGAYNSEPGEWFTTTLVRCLRRREVIDAIQRTELISLLMETMRGDIDAVGRIQPMLRKWRETSAAPVTTGDMASTWLGLVYIERWSEKHWPPLVLS